MFRKKLLVLLLLGAIVFFTFISIDAYFVLAKQAETITAYGINAVTQNRLTEIKENEEKIGSSVTIAFWNQTNKQPIIALSTSRAESVTVNEVSGSSRLLYPEAAVLAENDTTGCLIDKTTAIKLWGNANATGAVLEYNEKEYTVRGVLTGPANTMVIANKEKALFTMATLEKNLPTDEDFFLRNGINGEFKVSQTIYRQMALLAISLPLLVLLVLLLMVVVKMLKVYKGYLLSEILLSVSFFVIITATLVITIKVFPIQLIPSQWSNFEQWGEIGKLFLQNITDYLFSNRTRPDLFQLGWLAKSMLGCLSGFLLVQIYRIVKDMSVQKIEQ